MRGTIVIADDSAAFRAVIRAVLEDADYVVVGEAADGAEAIRLVEELQPDAVTMDLEMPVLDGAEATLEICRDGCVPVVIVSGSESSELIGLALEAGARWHVAKKDVEAQLPSVLQSLLRVTAG